MDERDGDTFSGSQDSDLSNSQLQAIEEKAKPSSTKRSTEYGIKKFRTWLQKRGKLCDFSTIEAAALNELLRKYYAEVKPCKQGDSLSPSTLTCLRASIHRYLTGAPFNRAINILKDREFMSSNLMFTSRCKLYFQAGNKKPQHKPPIGDGDMKILGEYFTKWQSNPDVLLEACWFNLCFFFGRRGREGWAQMTKDTFSVDTDSEGERFVSMLVTEVTKNHQGGYKQKDMDYSSQRMYGPGVEIFEFYKSKLHPVNNRLFQTPLRSYLCKGHWFSNEPMGKNTLACIMQRISKKAGLSCVYTCHSVRASTITTLFQAGVSPQSIISITKHKNTSSLNHYISDLSTKQKRDCADVLSKALHDPDMNVKRPDALFDSPEIPDEEMPNFGLGFDMELDEESHLRETSTRRDDAGQPLMDVVELGPQGTVVIPEPVPEGRVINLSIDPRAPLQDLTNTSLATCSSGQNVTQNIMTHASFHGCTITFQMKQT